MLETIDLTKSYAAHFVQLGSAYVKYAMLSFDGEHGIFLRDFEREYPRTIFLSGTILIYEAGQEIPTTIAPKHLISLEEMQALLNETGKCWAIQVPTL